MKMFKHTLPILLVLLGTGLCAQKTAYTHINKEIVLRGDTIHYTFASTLDNLNASKLVIIIPGSGPTDRDGNSLMMSGKGEPYKMLADSLSKHGFASIRYDKPGVGESTWHAGENNMTFELNVEVVMALIEAEKKKDLKIYLAGHSEGSLIGMLAAQKADIAGFISFAGAARNAAEVLRSQLSQSPGLTAEMKQDAMVNLDSLSQGHQITKYNPLLASIFRPSVQPYLIGWFAHTPTEEIAKLNCPVLIMQGEQDIQVPSAAAEALGHYAPNATVKVYPGVNHVLKHVNDDMENRLSYVDNSYLLSKDLVRDLIDWLNAH